VLPKPPVQSVSSITYTDANGDAQTWSSANYTLSKSSGPHAAPAVIEPVYGVSWPVTRNVIDAVTVRFVCGYGDAGSAVPEPIRAAMNLLITHWYEQRGVVQVGNLVTPLQHSVDALLWPFKAFV
jgi:uncharacterized phiE125 gp8 family phage protein